jgi:hypothetical protein
VHDYYSDNYFLKAQKTTNYPQKRVLFYERDEAKISAKRLFGLVYTTQCEIRILIKLSISKMHTMVGKPGQLIIFIHRGKIIRNRNKCYNVVDIEFGHAACAKTTVRLQNFPLLPKGGDFSLIIKHIKVHHDDLLQISAWNAD